MEENSRPNLNNPEEWAIVREMYFNTDSGQLEEEDTIEQLERLESRIRNNNKSSR